MTDFLDCLLIAEKNTSVMQPGTLLWKMPPGQHLSFNEKVQLELTTSEEKKQQERAKRITEGITSLLQSHRSGFLVQHPDEQKNTGAWKRPEPKKSSTKICQPVEYQWDWISTYSGVAVRFDHREICVSPDHPSKCSHQGPCFPWVRLGNYYSRNMQKTMGSVQLRRQQRVDTRIANDIDSTAKLSDSDKQGNNKKDTMIYRAKSLAIVDDETKKNQYKKKISSERKDSVGLSIRKSNSSRLENKNEANVISASEKKSKEKTKIHQDEKDLKDLAEKVKEYLRAVRGTDTDVEKKKLLEEVPIRMSKDNINRQKFRFLHVNSFGKAMLSNDERVP